MARRGSAEFEGHFPSRAQITIVRRRQSDSRSDSVLERVSEALGCNRALKLGVHGGNADYRLGKAIGNSLLFQVQLVANDKILYEDSPDDIYDNICPDNPLELELPAKLLAVIIKALVDDAEEVVDDDVSRELLLRRRMFLEWINTHGDGVVSVGLYPCWPESIRIREYVMLNPEDNALPPIILSRIRAAIEDDKAFWSVISSSACRYPKVAEYMKLLHDWARVAFDSAMCLKYSPSPDSDAKVAGLWKNDELPASLRRQYAMQDCVLPLIAQRAAEHALHLTVEATLRTAQILEFVSETHLPSDVSAFLERLAQLYIWGFDSEAYALARGVIEAALKNRMSDDTVWAHLEPSRKRRYPNLEDRIDAAHRAGILSNKAKQLAGRIRRDANDVLHEFPNANLCHKSPLAMIRSTAAVVRELVS